MKRESKDKLVVKRKHADERKAEHLLTQSNDHKQKKQNPRRGQSGSKKSSEIESTRKRKQASLENEETTSQPTKRSKESTEPLHPFQHDPADDCETCFRAYQDICPFLCKLAQRLGKSKEELCIWDPYFCAGQVKVHLKKLGFKNVVNENKDFYALIDCDELPPFDVFMTSPPYSRDHIERCLEFAVSSKKPFFLLMPQYVHRKAYYSDLIGGIDPFFMHPSQDYVYYAHHGGRKDNTKVPCRHWLREGKCRFGAKCQFLHGVAASTTDPSPPSCSLSEDGSKKLVAVTPFKSVWHLHFSPNGANAKIFTWAIHKLRKAPCKLVRSSAELPVPT